MELQRIKTIASLVINSLVITNSVRFVTLTLLRTYPYSYTRTYLINYKKHCMKILINFSILSTVKHLRVPTRSAPICFHITGVLPFQKVLMVTHQICRKFKKK